jgi:hypothetical protein
MQDKGADDRIFPLSMQSGSRKLNDANVLNLVKRVKLVSYLSTRV